MNKKLNLLLESKIIPVVNHIKAEPLIKLIDLCKDLGISAFEFTARNENALDVFKELKKHSDKILLGIGSITNINQVNTYAELGADFIVSPGIIPDAEKIINQLQCPLVMGGSTASEILKICSILELNPNYKHFPIKFFPASSLGLDYFKAIQAPLKQLPIHFMVTGGINPDNYQDWINAGAKSAGMGSELIQKAELESGEFKITADKIKKLINKN